MKLKRLGESKMFKTRIDGATALSLSEWLEQRYPEGQYRERAFDLIINLLHDYPELPSENRTWTEIESLAEASDLFRIATRFATK